MINTAQNSSFSQAEPESQPQATSTDSIIEQILLKENYITQEDAGRAEEYAKQNNSSIVEYLLSQGLITNVLLGQAFAEIYKIPYADLATNASTPAQVLAISEELARKHRVVLFKWDDQSVTFATDNPDQQGLIELLSHLYPGKRVSLVYALSQDIDASFIHYRKPLETRFSEIIATQTKVAPEIIEEIVSDALTFKASDIHFEPQENQVVVRFRIDGILHEAGRVSKEIYENILSRIKVQARMRIDEHFAAQDGAIRFPKDKGPASPQGGFIDMRVSIIPILDGESIVIRLLSEYVKGFTFTDLGVSQKDQEVFLKAAKKPFGMILVTGPTGSGKSTTLYALIKMLNLPDVNITTIEDPVEYKVLGINQIQVNTQTGVTFAKGLRSIIRQDPDIILVGEIRDLETSEIAVNAALIGHLLFSTFHANDAATAIPRLLDMGVEPFLMASSLELIIAQRLVRKICTQCKVSITSTPEELEKTVPGARSFFPEDQFSLYKGKGCKNCGNTGYKGRTAIFEFIQIEGEMQELILRHPSTREIADLARKNGSHSLFEDGLEKVKNGITTIEELLRVTTPQEK